MTDVQNLLAEWKRRAMQAETAHFKQSARYTRMYYLVGLPAVILQAIVSTAVFGQLTEQYYWIAGLFSLGATVAGIIHVWFRFNERALENKKAATGWSKVRREIEVKQIVEIANDNKYIETLKTRIDQLSEESPVVQDKIWEFALSMVRVVPPKQEPR